MRPWYFLSLISLVIVGYNIKLLLTGEYGSLPFAITSTTCFAITSILAFIIGRKKKGEGVYTSLLKRMFRKGR